MYTIKVIAMPKYPKYLLTIKKLKEMILIGKFKPGARIPADRELLKCFDVSYMTFRRAMNEICGAGIIERRGRHGSFISRSALAIIGLKKTLFVYRTWEGPFFDDLLNVAVKSIEQRGRLPSIIHFKEGVGRTLISALEQGESVILYGGLGPRDFGDDFDRMMKAAEESGSLLVALGAEVPAGIPRVKADDEKAMVLALERLRADGHSQIALIAPSAYLSSELYSRISLWFDHIRTLGLRANAMDFFIGIGHWQHLHELRTLIEGRLANRPAGVSAVICLGNAELLAMLSACRNLHIEVPKDLSVILVGDCSIIELLNPPISAVSVDLEQHMEVLLQMITEKERGEAIPVDIKLVCPFYIERESVVRFRADGDCHKA